MKRWLPRPAVALAGALCSQPLVAQARVVIAPPEPSLLSLTRGWARASVLGDLRELTTSSDFLELRLWHGYGLTETDAIVLRRSNGSWSAFYARVIRCEIQIPIPVGDTASPATMQRYVAEARRNCGMSVGNVTAGSRIITADTLDVARLPVPETKIEAAWKDALAEGVFALPGLAKSGRVDLDGLTYLIEVRRSNEYRASQIEDMDKPEVEADRQVKRIYAVVQRIRESR